jgi:hypothetical protein
MGVFLLYRKKYNNKSLVKNKESCNFARVNSKSIPMETVMIQVNDNLAFKFFQNLEALNLIKVLQKTPETEFDDTLRTKRLEKIKKVTKNINIDLSNYQFNREEANNYDE